MGQSPGSVASTDNFGGADPTLYNPSMGSTSVVAFLAGTAVMILELTASRVLAPHVGNTLYTWTAVIEVSLRRARTELSCRV